MGRLIEEWREILADPRLHRSQNLGHGMRLVCRGAKARWRLEQVPELITEHEDAAGYSEDDKRQAQHQRDPQVDLA
jgi:hypothetical protein